MIKKLVMLVLIIMGFYYGYTHGYLDTISGFVVKENNFVIISGIYNPYRINIKTYEQFADKVNVLINDGSLKTDFGNTNYNQNIKFYNPGFKLLRQNNKDVLSFYGVNGKLKGLNPNNLNERINYDNPIIEFNVNFKDGLKLQIGKDDLINKKFKENYYLELFGTKYKIDSIRKNKDQITLVLTFTNKENKLNKPTTQQFFTDTINDNSYTIEKITYAGNYLIKDKLQLTTIGTRLNSKYDNNTGLLTINSISYRIYSPLNFKNDVYTEKEFILKQGETLRNNFVIDFYEGTNLLLGNFDLKLEKIL